MGRILRNSWDTINSFSAAIYYAEQFSSSYSDNKEFIDGLHDGVF